NTVQGVLETMIDKNKYQKDDNGDDELAQDLVNELGGIDPGLVNPYSASTTVLGPLAGEGDIADNPAVAVVKGKAGSGDLSDAQGTVVAYIYRDGGRTVAELHPFDGSGNRRDEDGRTVMP
ncbi:MAG: hypothetical protein H5T97_14125, partial [Firmicutes bacterium]|nr:hypothetical protein [Bacillota bacterium]